jgi:hypothetical protein
MALCPLVATQLTTPAARKWTLTIGGLDVAMQQGGAKGTSYGVEIDSVTVTEVGCDQVSSLSFVIDDPAGILAFEERAPIHFHDCVRDVPLFEGFLDRDEVTQEGLARRHHVTAIGIEVVLDWLIIPSPMTVIVANGGGSPLMADVAQALLGQAIGVGVPLRAFQNLVSPYKSNAATPIDSMPGIIVATDLVTGDLVLGGKTLRQALATCSLLTDGPAQFTVDFYGGLRMSRGDPSDIVGMTVNGVTWIGADIKVGASYGEVIHQVYVQGGSASGTGVVSDGTGVRGPTGVVSEPLVTGAKMRDSLGRAWLSRRGALQYGTLTIEDQATAGTYGAERRAFATVVVINSPEMGFTGPTIAILSVQKIEKTFRSGGTEVWQIAAGAKVTGAGAFMRRLTPTAL